MNFPLDETSKQTKFAKAKQARVNQQSFCKLTKIQDTSWSILGVIWPCRFS